MGDEHNHTDKHSALEECSRDILIIGALIILVLFLGTPLAQGFIDPPATPVQAIAE